MLTAYLSSARSPSPEQATHVKDPKAELVERLLRHLETDWRPEHTTLEPANGDELHITARPGAEVTRLVLTCNGSGHITIRLNTDVSPSRTSVRHCGAKADTVARIKLMPTESVTVTPSAGTIQVLWGTRKATAEAR